MKKCSKLGIIIVLIPLLFAFIGCSSGGKSSKKTGTDIDDDTPTIPPSAANNPPVATLSFPTALSVTDADTITVTGTATDPDGDAIQYVSVNGVNATTDDGFATWRASISLNPGDNSISIEVADDNSAVTNLPNIAAISNRGHAILKPTGLDIDLLSNKLYVADVSQGAIISVDIATGISSLVSGLGIGGGSNLNSPYGVAFDSTNNRLIVVDTDINGLFAIDPTTGNRTVVTGTFVGNGPQFVVPLNLDFDSNTQTAYVVDRTAKAVVEVDLNTGDRTVISSNTIGSGVNFVDPYDIALNTSNGNLLVLDISLDAVIEVSATTGARTIITDANTGGGTAIDTPEAISYDAANNQAIITCLDYIIKVNLANGLKTLVSGFSVGNGEAFDFLRRATVSNDGNTIYVAENFNSNIVAVNTTTGDRQNTSSFFIGNGNHYTTPQYVTHGIIDNHITVIDRRDIIDLDLATGLRTIISGDTVGTGQAVTGFDGGYYDQSTDTLYVLNGVTESLLTVDYNNGDRTVISEPGVVGSGVSWPQAVSFAIKSSSQMAYTFHFNHPTVYQADLTTGARSQFSNGTLGLGFPIYSLRDGLYDIANDRLLIIDSVSDAILAIDADSGDRTLLTSHATTINYGGVLTTFPQTGTGPQFGTPLGIGVNESGNTAYIADRDLNTLFKVDLVTGNRTILADDTHGSGPNFADPSKVFVDSEKNIAYVVDFGFRAVYAVELETGERVIISK